MNKFAHVNMTLDRARIQPSPEDIRRLDDLHFMYRCHLGTNIVAPIEKPKAILDVGTGSGRWAIEVALEHPMSTVTGIDIFPVSPNFEVPQNCTFILGDLTNGLQEFGDGSHDFVHSRSAPPKHNGLMIRAVRTALKKKEWIKYMNDVLRILKPGGWVQFTEYRGVHLLSEAPRVPECSALREARSPYFKLLTALV